MTEDFINIKKFYYILSFAGCICSFVLFGLYIMELEKNGKGNKALLLPATILAVIGFISVHIPYFLERFWFGFKTESELRSKGLWC